MGRYRYSLKKAGDVYYRYDGKNVSEGAVQYFDEGIVDFEQLGVTEVRNPRMMGYFREIEQRAYPFTFALRAIVKHVVFKYGITAQISIRIERMSNYQFKTYELDYETQIDLSTMRSEKNQFVAELLQGDIEGILKARENTEFEVNIAGSVNKLSTEILPRLVAGDISFITMKGDNLSTGNRNVENYNWPALSKMEENLVKVLDALDYRPIYWGSSIAYVGYLPGHPEVGQPANELTGTPGNYIGYLFGSNVDLQKVRVKFVLPLNIDNTSSSDATFAAVVYQADNQDRTGGGANYTALYSTPPQTVNSGSNQNIQFDIDCIFDLPKDKVIHIIVTSDQVSTGGGNLKWIWENAVVGNITFQHYTSAFKTDGITLMEAFSQLVTLATRGRATAKSNLLTQDISYKDGIDCKPAKIQLLSDTSIMQKAGSSGKLSLAGLFKGVNTILCASMGIEREYDSSGNVTQVYVRMERKDYVFQEKQGASYNVIADLGDVAKEPFIEYAQELTFTEVHIGYLDEKDSGEKKSVNRDDEFNTTLKMITSDTTSVNTLDLVSPISAAGWSIYETWIKGATSQSEDTDGGNKLFFLQYVDTPSGPKALYPRDINPAITPSDILFVLDSNRMLNIGLSPKRCLIRHAYYLYSCMYNSDLTAETYKMGFVSLDRNQLLSSRLTSTNYIIEHANVNLHSIVEQYGQKRVFYPFYINYDAATTVNIMTAWKIKRYGVYKAIVDGKQLYGFPTEVESTNAYPKLYNVKMLLAPSISPTTLM